MSTLAKDLPRIRVRAWSLENEDNPSLQVWNERFWTAIRMPIVKKLRELAQRPRAGG